MVLLEKGAVAPSRFTIAALPAKLLPASTFRLVETISYNRRKGSEMCFGEPKLSIRAGEVALITQDAALGFRRFTVPRPPSDNPRHRQLNLALTEMEYHLLVARADDAGIRLVDFGRACLFDKTVLVQNRPLVSRVDRLVLLELSRIGSNLNQIARALNSFGRDAPTELTLALTELRQIINRVGARDR